MTNKDIVLVLVLGLVAGCAWPAAAPAGTGEPLAGSLAVQVAGDSVRLTLHATNVSGRTLKLEYPSGQRYDFAVLDQAGRTVWQWSADRSFLQALGEEVVPAGGTLQYAEVWRPGTLRGQYTAIGRLTSSNVPVEMRAEFRVGED